MNCRLGSGQHTLGSVELLRDATGGEVGVLAIDGDVAKGDSLREAISNLELRHLCEA